MERPRSRIGEILSLIRHELYLTQEELGNEMGLSRTRITDIENISNDEDLPLETVLKIYYFANTMQNNISMNEMICNAAKMLFEISDSIILEKLKNEIVSLTTQRDKLDDKIRQLTAQVQKLEGGNISNGRK